MRGSDEVVISTVTLAELSVGTLVATSSEDRVARLAHLQQAEADFAAFPFDSASARAFGRVAGALRTAGPKPAVRVYDALIAATAISNGLTLYTCNPNDFSGIDELDVVAVQHPDVR